MPRRPDPSRRIAILAAAVAVVAEDGLGAPVSAIAARAGVAQGSVFNHFATKLDLLNETYKYLVADLEALFPPALPDDAQFEAALRELWDRWMRWNTDEPNNRVTQLRLLTSGLLTPETLAEIREIEEPGARFLRRAKALGSLRDEPDAYVFGIISGIAQQTMDFMLAYPERAGHFCDTGYQCFRRALS